VGVDRDGRFGDKEHHVPGREHGSAVTPFAGLFISLCRRFCSNTIYLVVDRRPSRTLQKVMYIHVSSSCL
jgi:hypothetical protein